MLSAFQLKFSEIFQNGSLLFFQMKQKTIALSSLWIIGIPLLLTLLIQTQTIGRIVQC